MSQNYSHKVSLARLKQNDRDRIAWSSILCNVFWSLFLVDQNLENRTGDANLGCPPVCFFIEHASIKDKIGENKYSKEIFRKMWGRCFRFTVQVWAGYLLNSKSLFGSNWNRGDWGARIHQCPPFHFLPNRPLSSVNKIFFRHFYFDRLFGKTKKKLCRKSFFCRSRK
jgi:hypothetical protein